MKIVLLYLCHYEDKEDYYISLVPHGLGSLAAYLEREGYDVALANFSAFGYKKAFEYINKNKPEIVGISLFSFNRVDSLKLVDLINDNLPKTKTILGGPHATFLSQEIIKRYNVDFIVAGEGEGAFLELLKSFDLNKKILKSEKVISGERIKELDLLPLPSTFSGETIGVNPNEQYKYIITTRGCPSNCSYCSSPAFWKRNVTFRSAENIIEEVKFIHNKFGIIYFSIRDDNFTLNKNRVLEFCRLLQQNNLNIMWNCQARVDTIDEEMLIEMKRSGLEHIQYGVESGSERILNEYSKSLKLEKIYKAAEFTRKVGVYLSIYLMVGMTGETDEDIDKTIVALNKILPSDVIVSPVAYFPGTDMYERKIESGDVEGLIWFENQDSGIFLRKDKSVKKWVNRIMNEFESLRKRSWYKPQDFKKQKEYIGETWVTNILEIDWYLHNGQFAVAKKLVNASIKKYPKNFWFHLRLGKLGFYLEDYGVAHSGFSMVTKIVPRYYGAWLKLSILEFEMNNKAKARKYIQEAFQLNPMDDRVAKVYNELKK